MVDYSLSQTIARVQESIEKDPDNEKLRIHLFQLFAQSGHWQQSLEQLQVAAQLSVDSKLLLHTYSLALSAESTRQEVFAGQRVPKVLGRSIPWIEMLMEALHVSRAGDVKRARALRAKAFDAAKPSQGSLNNKPFAWIADADSRLGPVLEVITNGIYYWIPFESISEIKVKAPEDLRDLVWLPAHVKLVDEGSHAVLLPARYPLEYEMVEDGHLRSKVTSWTETTEDEWIGHGVKIMTTDTQEISLLDVRHIRLQSE